MVQLPAQVRIFIGIEALDFRNGFNGTAAACRLKIGKNPLQGGLFVFTNKNRTMVRLYFFDGHGEWTINKRAVRGRFSWWKEGELPEEVMMEHIQLLLRGGDPRAIHLPRPWKRLE